MKYCYRCGTPYEEDECPVCHTDLYTEKPNSRTQKEEKSESRRVNTDLLDLVEETKKLK